MKYLALLLISTAAYSDEILLGSFTHHLPVNAHMDRYENKVDNYGDIINPMVGYRLSDEKNDSYRSNTYFLGENSIGSAMAGYAYSPGVKYGDLKLGFVLGGYLQNDKQFHDRSIYPPAVPVGDFGIVPLAGIEVGYSIGKTTVYVVTTPILMTAVIGINF